MIRRGLRGLPLARTGIAAIALAAVIAIAFTAGKVRVRMPWAPDPFVVEVQLVDAAGLDAADHPAAGVAGTRQGRVVDVSYRGGRAVATLELDHGVQGKVFNDATAVVRPAGVVPVLAVNVLPGTPSAGRMRSGATIPTARSASYVAPDRVVGMLDADTRAYLEVLVDQAAAGLHGRGGDLGQALRQLAPLAHTARRVTAAVADRRVQVRRLVGRMATLSGALDARRDDLVGAIDAGDRVLDVTSARADAMAKTLRGLPPMLASARTAVREVGQLADPLQRGLTGMTPTLKALPTGLKAVDALLPDAQALLDDVDALERQGKRQLPAIRSFTRRLGPSAERGLPDVTAAARVAASLAKYGKGVAQLGDLVSGAVSTSDANGISARAQFTTLEVPKPENLGLSAADARVVPSGTSRMMRLLALALERRCATNTIACVLRVSVPGLPEVTAK